MLYQKICFITQESRRSFGSLQLDITKGCLDYCYVLYQAGVVYKIADDHAFIVTNQHVINGASAIEVSLADGSRIEAELVGEDVLTDLAVLRIDSDEVQTVAEFGDSNTLRVGEPAIAIGNPLGLEFASSFL